MPDHRKMQQVANKDANEIKTVSVSEDYLAFLHDVFSENQVRLREILGESQAEAVFSWSADRLIHTAGVGKYELSPIEGVVQKLTDWGMTVSWKEKGDLTELEVKCPYAASAHPRISSSAPKCPLGEYILGAVRLEDSKSLLVHNGLTEEGVSFTLKRARPGG